MKLRNSHDMTSHWH